MGHEVRQKRVYVFIKGQRRYTTMVTKERKMPRATDRCYALSNTNLECTLLILSHAPVHLEPRRNSLTTSYVKNDVAMLGATFTVMPSAPSKSPSSTKFILTQIRPKSTVHPTDPLCLENNACRI